MHNGHVLCLSHTVERCNRSPPAPLARVRHTTPPNLLLPVENPKVVMSGRTSVTLGGPFLRPRPLGLDCFVVRSGAQSRVSRSFVVAFKNPLSGSMMYDDNLIPKAGGMAFRIGFSVRALLSKSLKGNIDYCRSHKGQIPTPNNLSDHFALAGPNKPDFECISRCFFPRVCDTAAPLAMAVRPRQVVGTDTSAYWMPVRA